MWRYEVQPRKSGGPWAVFLIDSTGMFSVVSDRGNYANWWSNFGERDFRTFLADLDGDYVRRKLNPALEYDGKATLKLVEAEIKTARTDGRLDARQEEVEWEVLSEHSELAAIEDFAAWARDTRLDPCELARSRPPNDIMEFVKTIYPKFVEMLKQELAKEAQDASRPHA